MSSTVSEEERLDMANSLEHHLGRQTTMTLMRHLPPTGWGDVATVRDLDQLEIRLDARFDAKLQALQSGLQRWFIGTMLALIGTMVALASAVTAVVLAVR
jgi:hypothetical protein